MPFRRNSRFKAPIKTDKHEITWSNLGQNAGSVQQIILAAGTNSADKDTSTEVEVGSHVRSIYFEFHFSAAQTGNVNVIHWNIFGSKTGETIGIPSTYYTDNRSAVFKRGMEMLPVNVSTVFKRIFVVRIPKKFQRMTKNAFLIFQYIASSTQTINACGIAIYKEQY